MIVETTSNTSSTSLVISHNRDLKNLHKTLVCPWPDLDSGVMAAIPQTLHMTKSVQKQQRRPTGNTGAATPYFDTAEMDQPARYNSKLMNSIWGRYNENSVHNFKSQQCGTMNVAGGAYNTNEVGQTLLQPSSPPLNGRNAMKKCLRELGDAVSNNFMDNLNQY